MADTVNLSWCSCPKRRTKRAKLTRPVSYTHLDVYKRQLLYDFQKDAVLAIINKLERYNGCILADSVGLGKTFTALAVVKYYENRNKSLSLIHI